MSDAASPVAAGRPWGLLAEFRTADDLVAAARAARAAGYSRIEAYAPFHVEGLAEAVGFKGTHVAGITFIGGLLGGIGAWYMQWYAATIDYPVNIGGRPLNSWPMFMPIVFEMVVLFGALAAVLTLLIGSGLPRLTYPVFNAKDFDLATRNRFFLCLRSDDPLFDLTATARLLDGLDPIRRLDVPRAEVPRAEVPRAEVPRAEVPRAEVPQAGAPRSGASR